MPAWLESAWLARYLDRQLGDEESAWFEAYLMDKPELLGMVEADSSIANALQQSSESLLSRSLRHEDSAALGPERGRTGRPGARPAGATRISSWAAAAALVVGVSLGWASRWGSPSAGNQIIANPERLVYDTTRGGSSEPKIENRAASSAYVLIEIAVPSIATQPSLRIDDGAQWDLEISPDGFISVLLRRDVFTSAKIAHVNYQVNGKVQTKNVPLATSHGEGN